LQQMLSNPNMTDKQSLMMVLGSVAGSGLNATFNPYGDEQQQLQYKKAMQDKRIATAKEDYQTDQTGRLREEQIADIDANNLQKNRDLTRREDELKVKRFEASTKRANTMINLVKTGRITPADNPELIDALSDSVGAKVRLDDFNPVTDKITNVKVVQDAQNNKAYVVTTSVNGVVKEQVMKDEFGNVAFIKDPRVKAEEIRANTNITTTTMRIKSAQELEGMKIKSREKLAQMGLDQKEIDAIQEEELKRWQGTDEDDVVEEAAKEAGKSPKDLTPEQRQAVLDAYWDNERQKIIRNRGTVRGNK
jgi:hypothetical protein